MIEQRIADRFRTAVLDEPPLGFDPDDVVDRAKRQQRRRRAMAASAAATVGVALAAVALFAVSGGGARLEVGSPPASVAPPTTGGSTPPSVKENVDPSTAPQIFPGSEAAVAHLGQVIPVVLAEKVPDLRFTRPDSDTLMVDSERREVGGAYLATGTKHRYVSVFVSHKNDGLDLAGDPAAGNEAGWGPPLSDTVQPDGSHVRVYTFGSSAAGDAQALTVVHLRIDGVIVLTSTTAKPEPGRSGLAVSQQVLTSIATDARLTF